MDNITAKRLVKARKMADYAWSHIGHAGIMVEFFRATVIDLPGTAAWWRIISREAGCKSDPGPETVEMCRALLIAKCDGALSMIESFGA